MKIDIYLTMIDFPCASAVAVSGGQANDGAPHGDELILVPSQNS